MPPDVHSMQVELKEKEMFSAKNHLLISNLCHYGPSQVHNIEGIANFHI
jgi:hypothetical protein